MSRKFRGWAKMNARANHPVYLDALETQQNRDSQGAKPFPPASLAPVSDAKVLANRANAQLSTGATSELGKAIVALNATKHGLTGRFRVLSSESQTDFDEILASLLGNEQPVGEDEVAMVHQMAESLWLSRRSVRMQNDCFALLEFGTEGEKRTAHKNMALYLRYQTTHERTFLRLSTELRKRRNERRKVERGFVSQKYREAAEARREAGDIRKKEVHELRTKTQILRQERIEINNRLAEAKLERSKPHAAAA